MRLLILLLALLSAFFSSADDSTLPYDPNDLRGPESKPIYEYKCEIDNTTFRTIKSEFEGLGFCQESWQPKVDEYIASMKSNNDVYYSVGNYTWVSATKVEIENTPCSPAPCSIYNSPGNPSKIGLTFYGQLLGIEWQHTCPPSQHPDYQFPVMKDPQPTDPAAAPMMCAKLLDGTDPDPEPDPEPDPDCPAPTDNDPYVFGTGGQTSVCFPAANGRQCQIQTDSNGGYYIPVSYGSAEPLSCVPDPVEPEEPEEPDNPDDPEPTPDNPDDPEPTPDPDAPDAPDDADDSDKNNDVDGINQINDNLKVINDNMNSGVESHTERLDRMAKETQNSNELLATIKSNTLNTYKGASETTDVIRDQIKETVKVGTEVGTATTEIKKGNTEAGKQTVLLEGIKENTKTESISITSTRKKGGLNDIFSADDLAQVTAEIEDKKTELTEYIETIKTESESILDLDPNISGGYSQHKEIIKGVEVDMGIGRFSSFYQAIAPAIILIASITALFIILGGNKE